MGGRRRLHHHRELTSPTAHALAYARSFVEPIGSTRPLTARSVIASTLLGTHPPELPSSQLVRAGELFGIAEGTVRTAISRMVAIGELEGDGGTYRLAGALLARQARQDASRRADQRRWRGRWEMAVARPERRAPDARAELREAMRRLRRAPLREGVWLRPDNLDPDRAPESSAIVADQCRLFLTTPSADSTELAAELWDLSGWARQARRLASELERGLPHLERGEASSLADDFVVAAAVLRLLLADPLLPPDLVPDDWPGGELRSLYESYDRAFKRTWRKAFSTP
jgi:phenylacetic acid degradation operon negative regulatory protein